MAENKNLSVASYAEEESNLGEPKEKRISGTFEMPHVPVGGGNDESPLQLL